MFDICIYSLGRSFEKLTAPYSGEDFAFGGERFDNQTISDADYKHCTFANHSFLKTKIQNGNFRNCVFINCYFRRATIQDSRFIGCKFIDCDFSYVFLQGCDFKYSVFHGCQLSFKDFRFCLPTEYNLRKEITRNLAIESSKLGLAREARKYRIEKVEIHEKDLWARVIGDSRWYREHYGFPERLNALWRWFLSRLNRYLWGYGNRIWVLFINWVLFSVIIFPLLFHILQNGLMLEQNRLTLESEPNHAFRFMEMIYFSLENVMPTGNISNIIVVDNFVRILAGIESIFGVIMIALFASYIFRWSLHHE